MNDALLRRAALADGVTSLAVAGLLIVDAPLLAEPLGLTQSFLAITGWVIVPFALAWLFVALTGSRPLAKAGVIGNAAWALVSVAAIPLLAPTALGAAVITLQALAVLGLAYLQNRGLQRIRASA